MTTQPYKPTLLSLAHTDNTVLCSAIEDVEVFTDDQGRRVSWVHALMLGEWAYSPGNPSQGFEVTSKDIRDVKRNIDASRHVKPIADIDHGSTKPLYLRSGVTDGRAVGRLLDHREVDGPDGRHYLQVLMKWNDEGADLVENERYQYISPAFDQKAVHPETGKPIGTVLLAVALTNQPFTDMPALLAAARQHGITDPAGHGAGSTEDATMADKDQVLELTQQIATERAQATELQKQIDVGAQELTKIAAERDNVTKELATVNAEFDLAKADRDKLAQEVADQRTESGKLLLSKYEGDKISPAEVAVDRELWENMAANEPERFVRNMDARPGLNLTREMGTGGDAAPEITTIPQALKHTRAGLIQAGADFTEQTVHNLAKDQFKQVFDSYGPTETEAMTKPKVTDHTNRRGTAV